MSWLQDYNVVLETPGGDSGNGMPVGGHGIGLNVWVEDGDLLFYIDRSGSFDENNQMLKLGRVRVSISPTMIKGCARFRQTLRLETGDLEVFACDAEGNSVRMDVWVESERPVIHLDVHCDLPLRMRVTYESWRAEDRVVPADGRRHAAQSAMGYPGRIVTRADVITAGESEVMFFHRNRSADLIMERVIEQQGLESVREQLWNPQKNHTFGGVMYGDGFVYDGNDVGEYLLTAFQGWSLVSMREATDHHLEICLHADQCEKLTDWEKGLHALRCDATSTLGGKAAGQVVTERERARSVTRAWWTTFWERSHIAIAMDESDSRSKVWQVGRNYQLFRYLLGCNAYGSEPTKFNGGLFTPDPRFVDAEFADEPPDFRKWGGGTFTAQNQRLVYWPLLKSGDFALMEPQFEFYRRALGNAVLRTGFYWGHGGCSFTEQLENFGLPAGWGWGWKDSYDRLHVRAPYADPTEQVGPWIRYLYGSQLEFAFMMLQWQRYSDGDLTASLAFIDSTVRFFDEHYQFRHWQSTARRLDTDGHLVIFPSTACETYKDATNPTDVIAALTAVTTALLELPGDVLSKERRSYYMEVEKRIPPLSFRTVDGRRTIAPARSWSDLINVEIPQLYPLFPYELYGIGREDLQLVIDTWNYGVETEAQKNHVSWHQDNIFCARMGLTKEASEYAILKLADGEKAFPAFWGPGHDWLPDHNWGGSGMIGLQDMLLQAVGQTLYLFPAWPREWDVDFKLWAPGRTTVQGILRGGVLVKLVVDPPERAADLVNLLDQANFTDLSNGD